MQFFISRMLSLLCNQLEHIIIPPFFSHYLTSCSRALKIPLRFTLASLVKCLHIRTAFTTSAPLFLLAATGAIGPLTFAYLVRHTRLLAFAFRGRGANDADAGRASQSPAASALSPRSTSPAARRARRTASDAISARSALTPSYRG